MQIEIRDMTPAVADVVCGAVTKPESFGNWKRENLHGQLTDWIAAMPFGRTIGMDRPLMIIPMQGELAEFGESHPALHECFSADLLWLVLRGCERYACSEDGCRWANITAQTEDIGRALVLKNFYR